MLELGSNQKTIEKGNMLKVCSYEKCLPRKRTDERVRFYDVIH